MYRFWVFKDYQRSELVSLAFQILGKLLESCHFLMKLKLLLLKTYTGGGELGHSLAQLTLLGKLGSNLRVQTGELALAVREVLAQLIFSIQAGV
jgi:hypothetical protein